MTGPHHLPWRVSANRHSRQVKAAQMVGNILKAGKVSGVAGVIETLVGAVTAQDAHSPIIARRLRLLQCDSAGNGWLTHRSSLPPIEFAQIFNTCPAQRCPVPQAQ